MGNPVSRSRVGVQRLAAVGLSFGLAACVGTPLAPPEVDDDDTVAPEADDEPTPDAGKIKDRDGSSPKEDAAKPPNKEPEPAGEPETMDSEARLLRRLNRVEYDNTVAALLGTATKPASGFPADDVLEGFDTLGIALSFSPLLAEQAEQAATALVAELMARKPTDPVRMRILPCEPTAANAATCLPNVLGPFMKSAFRRPVSSAEVAEMVTFATDFAKASKDPAQGLAGALTAILLAPDFLYHVELGEKGDDDSLSPHELASRLSYFLWSTMPDAELTELADKGTLKDPAVLREQLGRMLDDPKVRALSDNFAGQWLSVRELSVISPDPDKFPAFTEALRGSMGQETQLFFTELVAKNQALSTLLLSDFTFANDALAKHYGLKGGTKTFSKLPLTGAPRFGLLTQETFLTVTSYPDTTSPVKRGNWVLEQILCDAPPPPPPNIPVLQVPSKTSGKTLREAQEEHRSSPACNGCHVQMDPIGLAFETYDAVGAFRTMDNGSAIDASGSLIGVGEFRDAKELVTLIANDPRFPRCVLQHMLTYAIGRPFSSRASKDYIAQLAEPLQKSGTWRQAIETVVTSQPFLSRRGAHD